jgi:surface protein
LGTVFNTVGQQTIKIHYRREYVYPESTILVEKELEQTIEVVDHGAVTSANYNNDIYADGYTYIHPMDDTIGNNLYWMTTGNFTKVSSLPWRTTSLKELNLPYTVTDLTEFQYADVSKVWTMEGAFYGLAYIESLEGLETWDVSGCFTAKDMFSGCTKLKDLKALKNWNWKYLGNTQGMFFGCTALEKLEGLEDWTFPNLTSSVEEMFRRCWKLNDISALRNWDVSKFTTTQKMFKECYALTDLSPLANWDVSNVLYMIEMFYCFDDNTGQVLKIGKLRNLHGLENWNVSNVRRFDNMFAGRAWLTDISALANWDMSKALQVVGMLADTTPRNLTAVKDWKFNSVLPYYYDDNDYTGFYNLFGKSGLEYSELLDKYVYESNGTWWDYDGNTYTQQQVGDLYSTPPTLYFVEQNAGGASSWFMPWEDTESHVWDSYAHQADVFRKDGSFPSQTYWNNKPSWNKNY